MSDEFSRDEIRTADEVARHTLALFAVVGLALGAERREVLDWLNENALWGELTPMELGFVDTPYPSEKQIINSSWLSERLIILVWALGAVDRLPPADQQCDTSVFQDILPPYADVGVDDFIAGAKLRPDRDLAAMADDILDLHWVARDAKLNGRAPKRAVNIEIIQERHHAINWVIGYDGAPWDEVTTDT